MTLVAVIVKSLSGLFFEVRSEVVSMLDNRIMNTHSHKNQSMISEVLTVRVASSMLGIHEVVQPFLTRNGRWRKNFWLILSLMWAKMKVVNGYSGIKLESGPGWRNV